MRWDNEGHALSKSRMNALNDMDRMSPGLRACVHEFGYSIVNTLRKFGISNPAHVREVVHQVWLGPREGGQSAGMTGELDYILAQGPVNAAQLQSVLMANSHVILPLTPTKEMVRASMAEVSNFDVLVTKEEKHRIRLTAAIKAAPRFK